jgi:iron-sulfur cluster repair protein YtfE (RIC family)
MNLDTTKTVREMGLNIPAATRVFKKPGIDYCCGGNKTLSSLQNRNKRFGTYVALE